MPIAKKGAAAPKKPTVSASHMSALNNVQKLLAGATASFSAEALDEATLLKNLKKRSGSNALLSINTEEGSQIEIWASTFERCFQWDEEQELFVLIEGARVGKNGAVYPPEA
jgi:hypothetical protein